MRICVFGAGAVGSHFAVRLALAGHDVSCVMRGPHLDAVKAKGLTLRVGDAEFTARVKASDDPAALGPQDVVISTLKATGLAALASGLPPLLSGDSFARYGHNLLPVDEKRSSKTSPIFNYPYSRTREALEQAKLRNQWDACH
ncbi:MAG TPA: 2-dehydropantoate 2-reductase N-terminal domain-containing protein, partial [Bradyrhizobium sp.]|nr:2-dehydropantoate 2-reductase N-terminal domain-containing protein [Bradyrhizobium sp.]